MKQRLGGLLAIALGAVLITTGLNNGAAGTVGAAVLQCGIAAPPGAVTPNCPTAFITFHETTTPTPGAGDPTPPAGGWTVKVTSTCNDPATLAPTDQSVLVPDNGTNTTTFLEVYTDQSHATKCTYNFSENSVAGFTTTYSPVSPIQLLFSVDIQETNPVDITNTFEVTPTSTTNAPSSSASSSTGPLANTGPRSQIGISLWFGIALCVLGLGLVFGGTSFRRRGDHA